jgi:hypothetical protein
MPMTNPVVLDTMTSDGRLESVKAVTAAFQVAPPSVERSTVPLLPDTTTTPPLGVTLTLRRSFGNAGMETLDHDAPPL